MMSVTEGNGMVQVCATLSAVNDIERDFSIALATDDGTGKFYNHGWGGIGITCKQVKVQVMQHIVICKK
jgi:hypothetical protein